MTTDLINQSFSPGSLKINVFGDKYLYNISRGNFEKIHSQTAFDTEFGKSLFQEDSLYIIIGTDSGLLPKYIAEKEIPLGSRYIFIEPSQILEQLKEHNLLENIPPEIVCTSPEQWEKHAKEFKIDEYSYINGVKSFNAICAQQTIIDDYSELSWQLTEALQILHFRCNISIGNEAFIVRQLQNIADNILPVSLLANAYQGKTVIILAGGPSLTSVFPWLLENRQKLVVFSVSRISRQLINAGINPDFVFSVDPYDINLTVSQEMFLFSDETIFINSYHVQPALLNQWQGQSLYLGERLPWRSTLNIDNIDGTGPTVTNSALSMAHYFGFNKILLAGFDLCFTKEGITHAQGSYEQKAGPKYDSTPLQVETYNGEFRPTGQDYYAALLTLNNQAQVITADHREIINLSPTAAKAEHIQHIPCSEIILPKIQIEDLTNARQRIPKLSDTFLNDYYKTVIDELEKAIFQIQAIAKLAQKALTINKKMYSSEGKIENYKEKRELDNIEKQLKRKYRNHSRLVKKFGVRNFIKITSPNDSDNWDAEKAKTLGNTYYQAYLNATNTLLTLINSTIARTKSRQEELKESADISLLLKQWEQDKSYRRATLWLKKHPSAQYSEKLTLALQTMQVNFIELLANQDNEFKTKIAQHSTLPLLKSKIKLLFKHKKIVELKNLKLGFMNSVIDENKAPYLLLIDAYLAELENEIETALTHYNNIINLDQSPLLEEALLRIASISLQQQNQKNALLAINCLSELSPIYLSYQAELARILGDYMLAIDSYNAYIEIFPEDILSKLKLISIYIDINVYEAAELMLDLILKTNPELESALALKSQLVKIKLGNSNSFARIRITT